MKRQGAHPEGDSGRPSQAEVSREIDKIKSRYGLDQPAGTDAEASGIQIEEQARYIAEQLGEEFSKIHRDLAPRLLTPEELTDLIAELKAYERFLVQEIVAKERDGEAA